MCWVQIAFAAVAAIGSIQKDRAENKAKKEARNLLTQQNEQRAEEIADASSVELNERARAARRARASARAAASESGINLNSGSFLAQLQAGLASQDVASGLVMKNEDNQQKARHINYQSAMAPLRAKSGLAIGLDAFGAAAKSYTDSGGQMYMGSGPGKG